MFWKVQGVFFLNLFLGRPREFTKPRITNPRKARDDYSVLRAIGGFPNFNYRRIRTITQFRYPTLGLSTICSQTIDNAYTNLHGFLSTT